MASIVSRNIVAESPNSEGLSSWWSKFKSKPARKEQEIPRSIFSVPLQESITYANVAISLYNDDGKTFIYGYIPIVVAKCGLFLKDNATETEGIFRLSGSAKRIKELQAIFDQPPKYGKGLDWSGFTVHDAANILRRYLNHLPDPIIPFDWYDAFREPLKANWPIIRTIKRMQELVASLPPLNRQLLLYILDLLAVFASKSEINRMTSENLSAIFQPGLITHPRDDMAPQEYRLSQEVLVFLIDNQSHFLLDSLCSPAGEQPADPSSQSKSSISRRRTVHTPKSLGTATPAEGPPKTNPTPIGDGQDNPRTFIGSSAAGLSRSNTVPTKRVPPSSSAITGGSKPRNITTPIMLPGDRNAERDGMRTKGIESSKTNDDTGISGRLETPSIDKSALTVDSPLDNGIPGTMRVEAPSRELKSPLSQSNLAGRTPEGTESPRSQMSSFIGADADFSVVAGRKPVAGDSAAHSLNASLASPGPLRPVSIGTASNLGDKAIQNKQVRTISSSPSKFSNLFKKKPRNQSISSTSEAGGRRDLDQ